MIIGNGSRMRRRTNSSFMEKVKQNNFKKLTINVNYGKGYTNSMECKKYSDLRWAIEAFLDKNLYI